MAPCDYQLVSWGTGTLKVERGALVSEDISSHYITKFYNGKKQRISYEQLVMGQTEWREMPHERYCVSCGGAHEATYFDQVGRCSETLNSVHAKRRKLFWARFVQHGKVPW